MMPLETVKIRNPGHPLGFTIINKSDLREGQELWQPGDAVFAEVQETFRDPRVDLVLDEAAINAKIVAILMARHLGVTVEAWGENTPTDRMQNLRHFVGRIQKDPQAVVDDVLSAPVEVLSESLGEEAMLLPVSQQRVLSVGKGPKGKWYVLDEKRRHEAGPFETEQEAMDKMAILRREP